MAEFAHQSSTDQKSQFYALIGEFAVSFELISFYMRRGIEMLLHLDGLNSDQMARAVSANLSAGPLLELFNSIMLQKVSSQRDREILAAIRKRTITSIEERNRLLHGTVFIERMTLTPEGVAQAEGFKEKIAAKLGPIAEPLLVSETVMRPKIDELQVVTKLVYAAWGCVGIGISLDKYFVFDGKQVDLPAGS